MILQTTIHIVFGLIGIRKCIALLISKRLVPELWIYALLAEVKVTLGAAMNSDIMP